MYRILSILGLLKDDTGASSRSQQGAGSGMGARGQEQGTLSHRSSLSEESRSQLGASCGSWPMGTGDRRLLAGAGPSSLSVATTPASTLTTGESEKQSPSGKKPSPGGSSSPYRQAPKLVTIYRDPFPEEAPYVDPDKSTIQMLINPYTGKEMFYHS